MNSPQGAGKARPSNARYHRKVFGTCSCNCIVRYLRKYLRGSLHRGLQQDPCQCTCHILGFPSHLPRPTIITSVCPLPVSAHMIHVCRESCTTCNQRRQRCGGKNDELGTSPEQAYKSCPRRLPTTIPIGDDWLPATPTRGRTRLSDSFHWRIDRVIDVVIDVARSDVPEVVLQTCVHVSVSSRGAKMHACQNNSSKSEEAKEQYTQLQKEDNDKVDNKLVRYSDGSVRLRNPNIELMDQDILYHLALGSGSHDLVEMFGDVKFVCMGGTPKRMEQFANYIMKEIGHKLPAGTTLLDISQYSYRYSMYKVGPVLSISHGMGIPSVGILLHEVIKLMYHAKVRDPVFFRIGTCGGIGYEGGTVVISQEAVDGMLKNYLELSVLGKITRRPAKLDRQLARDLKALAHRDDPYDTVIGKTMCTNDFYEEQGRLDGAFCDFTENDKMEYLTKMHKAGVVNIEMESLCFAALTHHASIQSAVVCVTLLDRLKGDQVLAPKEVLDEWQVRPQKLVARYITTYLQRKGRLSLEGHGSMCVKSPRRYKLVQQESENYD